VCLIFELFAESAEKGTRFVEDGVRELLKARRVLCGSYVYGYYLEDNGYNKIIFEFMQVSICSMIFQI
jgi:ankyrin repeat/IBR domain-containing protein 1